MAMEHKPSILDTIITGAICVACFSFLYLCIAPEGVMQELNILGKFLEKGDLLAKWTAVGVGCHILGSIVSVISICYYRRPWDGDPARRELKSRVRHEIEDLKLDTREDNVRREILKILDEADADCIFAWVHYCEPHNGLIEWGRRKLHYAYLAQNWRVAIRLGAALGGLCGLLASHSAWVLQRKPLEDFVDAVSVLERCVIVMLFLAILKVCLCALRRLEKENREYDNGMVAMYVAGRFWKVLEKRFLPINRKK